MKKQSLISQTILITIFIILCALVIIPFVMLVSVSVSNEQDIAEFGYSVLPKRIDFSAYEYVFKNPKSILDAYKVTIVYSVVHTVLAVLLQALMAYPLTKTYLRGRNVMTFYLYFTTLFSGGLVPTYILLTQYLHLNNTIWIYILPGLIAPWNIFMMRTMFKEVPNEICESMLIDGANEYNIFFKTILPLSKPVIATVALNTFLADWNNWYTSMLYIDKEELVSLQYLLQRIMQNIQLLQNNNTMDTSMMLSASEIPSETVRMAMAVVVAGPALVIFPFFQKYFVKGLTVGSVKG